MRVNVGGCSIDKTPECGVATLAEHHPFDLIYSDAMRHAFEDIASDCLYRD